MRTKLRSLALTGLALAASATVLTACGGSDASDASDSSTFTTEKVDVDALYAAAKKEGELTVWDSSGSVSDVAALFEKKYPGIKVNALKVDKSDQQTKLTAEAKGGHVSVDAVMAADAGALGGVYLPQHLLTSWFPEDLKSVIPADSQNPPATIWNPNVFFYNSSTYPQGCPVTNIWQLTTDDYKGKVLFEDPSQSPQFADWLSELQLQDGDKLAELYKEQFGKELSGNPGEELVKGLAKNAKIVADSDDEPKAVSASGSQMIAFNAADSIFDAQDQGFDDYAVCSGLQPWIGYASPKFAMLVNNAPHPNAAKLWIHFALGDEAMQPVLANGGFASNPNVKMAPGDKQIPGMAEDHSDLFKFDLGDLKKDWDMRQQTLDLWDDNAGK